MKTKSLKSFAFFALVLMVLSIIPSGAFAAGNGAIAKSTDDDRDMLQDRDKPQDCLPMSKEQCVLLSQEINEENFTEIQARMLEILETRIERLNESKALCLENGDEEKTEWIDARLTELQAFYTEIEGASNAGELEEVVFLHVKEKMLEVLDMKLEELEAKKEALTESEYEAAIAKLEEQISELEAFREELNGAEDLEALGEIKFSFAKEKMLDMLEKQIERFGDKLTGLNETGNSYLIKEKFEARISELEELKEAISNAESSEKLKEIRVSSWNLGGKNLRKGSGNGVGKQAALNKSKAIEKHTGRNGPKTIQC